MAEALMNHIDPEAIVLGVDTDSREAVIRLLAEKLQAAGYVKDSFADAVLAREASMPTGLPLGHAVNVAVPHTDPEHVLKPGIALATLKKPVAFANMEDPDEPVEVGLVFLMALNDKDRQIEMLQEIMATIQSEEAISGLMQASSVDDVAAVLK
ncbi:PTS sugar transporter subunit IIA [Nitratireductor aquimarinus]|uniref:PTS sugar transporter subunit IIA n=1 Tax=Nitratireductor aquimarinus TaxID=889300 RepID=A0ABU4AP08_9HYPH|nr:MULTISPECIES: PTS sugar transporter subunit IIA [Alphaproteobacteria]MBY6020348.1 PTS sugar transporter subunit IIA [Nitratireductor sp. DP7N14-4]MBN7755562.1 PTS sugar transporter subunit IIA [Nitratireductor aquimarinus]MBN7763359.1 PTS sugar transporter subunit IIA [Nitratireductor aquibiodomus]MBN7775920.1 PTS sugar transporter subunit IIA [Nitratireductor pacificus]MBN7780583.1 PTS sugar transporter subunit IIA [Nitratireductor pacificus]